MTRLVDNRDRTVTIQFSLENPIWIVKWLLHGPGHHRRNELWKKFLCHRLSQSDWQIKISSAVQRAPAWQLACVFSAIE
jgi:hypothetical protein